MKKVYRIGVLLGLLVALMAFSLWRVQPNAAAESVPVLYSMNMTICPSGPGFFLPASCVDVILMNVKGREPCVIMQNVFLTKIDPIGYSPFYTHVQAALSNVPLLGNLINRNTVSCRYLVELKLLPVQVRQIVAAQAQGELTLSLVPPQEDTADEGSDE